MRTMRSYLADFLVNEARGWEMVNAVLDFEQQFLYRPISSLNLKDCDPDTLCEIHGDIRTYLDSRDEFQEGMYVNMAKHHQQAYDDIIREKFILPKVRDEAAQLPVTKCKDT